MSPKSCALTVCFLMLSKCIKMSWFPAGRPQGSETAAGSTAKPACVGAWQALTREQSTNNALGGTLWGLRLQEPGWSESRAKAVGRKAPSQDITAPGCSGWSTHLVPDEGAEQIVVSKGVVSIGVAHVFLTPAHLLPLLALLSFLLG